MSLRYSQEPGRRTTLCGLWRMSSEGTEAASRRARQGQRARRPRGEQRQAEPEALALPRALPQRAEHHAVARRDLAAARQELAQPLLLLLRHRARAPLHVLLQRPEPRQLDLVARDGADAVVIVLLFARREEGTLDSGRRLLEPVEPEVVHSRECREEQSRQGDRGADDQGQVGEGSP